MSIYLIYRGTGLLFATLNRDAAEAFVMAQPSGMRGAEPITMRSLGLLSATDVYALLSSKEIIHDPENPTSLCHSDGYRRPGCRCRSCRDD